jgi:hypothetical protein
MSDLNEAIREHFALKRLHGADPYEVARLEQEVLGEVSRDTARELAHDPAAEADGVVEEFPSREELTVSAAWEEIAPPTNEYAPTRARSNRDSGEETQEYRVEEQIGWIGSPAWHGGAA